VLNDAEEQALYLYINIADEMSLFICEKTLIIVVNTTLQNYYFKDRPPHIELKM
jgi:hypothetical protein